MADIYDNLSTVRRQTNSSLSSIIGVNSRNFEGFYKALKGFFDQIYFNETTNAITLNTVKANTLLRSDGSIEIGQPSQPAVITLSNTGNITSTSLDTGIVTLNKNRFTPYTSILSAGLPGELVYVNDPIANEGIYYYDSTNGWLKVSTGSGLPTFQNGLIYDSGASTVELGGTISTETTLSLDTGGKFNVIDLATNGGSLSFVVEHEFMDQYIQIGDDWADHYVSPNYYNASAGDGVDTSQIELTGPTARVQSDDIFLDGPVRTGTGASFGAWKLGKINTTTVSGLDTTKSLTVQVDGVWYNIGLITLDPGGE